MLACWHRGAYAAEAKVAKRERVQYLRIAFEPVLRSRTKTPECKKSGLHPGSHLDGMPGRLCEARDSGSIVRATTGRDWTQMRATIGSCGTIRVILIRPALDLEL